MDKLFDNEPSEAIIPENNTQNRRGVEIYNGVFDSLLLDMYEKVLIIDLLGHSIDKAKIDTINTTKININELSRIGLMSVRKAQMTIKKLEEKGFLIKEKNALKGNDGKTTFKILNYISVWDSTTLTEVKERTDKIKKENGYC